MDYDSLSHLVKNYFYGGPGLVLARENIIGLYLEKEQLQYVCLSMTGHGWAPASPGPALDPYGIVQEPAPWSLKQFLEWLSVFPLLDGAESPRKKAIYLTLPRNNFSARDLQLPLMPMEDALESVENSLSVSCHLPLEEIYYDINLCRTSGGTINALILYAPRKNIDVYLDILRETNFLNSLKGIFPVSVGIGAWLDMQFYSMPTGLVLPQENTYELTVYQKGGCLFSGTWPVSEGTEGGEILTAAVRSKFEGLGDNIFYMNGENTPQLPLPSPDHLEHIPSITENLGAAAVAPMLSGWQQISVDGTVPRLNVFRPSRLLIPLALLLVLIMALMYGKIKWDVAGLEKKVVSISSEIDELKTKVAPLEQRRTAQRNARKFYKDIHNFMETRPRLFSLINEVARQVPEGTWFSQFNYQKGSITLKGEGPDALKTIEALRSSSMFDQINLKGSVNRNQSGVERFSIIIELKDNEVEKQ